MLILYLILLSPLFANDLTPVMHKNFQALMKLQPYIANPQSFRDPKNAGVIQENIDALAEVSKTLPKMLTYESKSGVIGISSLFSNYLLDIQKGFKSGNRDYVRQQLRTATGFCMECHTRSEKSKEFVLPEGLLNNIELSAFQMAEFLAATRQFDKALKAFEDVLFKNNSLKEADWVEASQSVRAYLSISVRVKQDPKLTSEFLDKLSKKNHIRDFFGKDLDQWKKDVLTWKVEQSPSNKKTNNKNRLAAAQKRITLAREHQAFGADHSGDVNYLRATNDLHQVLENHPSSKESAEAFYLLGTAYAALDDPLLWQLDGLYFEACIRTVPHTSQSKQCFKRLASSIYFGYTGTGGTHVPEDELSRLGALRKLAD